MTSSKYYKRSEFENILDTIRAAGQSAATTSTSKDNYYDFSKDSHYDCNN